jgi:hypothetical protein
MGKLPSRPQWYRDKIASLRAARTSGSVTPAEFLARQLLRADAARYDRAVNGEQRAQFGGDAADAMARGFIVSPLLPEEVLARLGLDVKLDLGFGRSVQTADATHEDRLKAIEELEDKAKRWARSTDRQVAAIRALDDLAGDRPLREVIEEPPAAGAAAR